MRSARTLTALVGLVLGLLVSAAAWFFLDTVVLFLFLPFVPFLFGWGRDGATMAGTQRVRRCPQCGFRTASPEYEYCPRDGSRLQIDDDDADRRS